MSQKGYSDTNQKDNSWRTKWILEFIIILQKKVWLIIPQVLKPLKEHPITYWTLYEVFEIREMTNS